jgi:hypothetical protein
MYILDRVMSFPIHTAVSREAEDFMEKYTMRHSAIIEKYQAIIDEEEAAARKATEAAAAMAEEAASRNLPKTNIRSYFSRKGGRRRRSRHK